MQRYLFFILFALILGEPARAMRVPCDVHFMTSEEAFLAHTESHIRRVQILGLRILQDFPHLFPGVTHALLSEFLLLHDQSKVNRTGPFLTAYGLADREQSILESLFARMNRWKDDPVGSRALVDELNSIDHQVAHAFFVRHALLDPNGAPGPVALLLKKIERIADVVDTVLSIARGEEFGYKDRMGLDKPIADLENEWPIVQSLEAYYQQRCADPTDHLFLMRDK